MQMTTASRLVPNPTHIWLGPTTRCNTRCRHCEHYYRDFGSDMERTVYHKIRDSVLDGVKSMELYGDGEPFLGACFGEMFEDCLSRGIRICLISNGILLRRGELAERLVRADVDLVLSVDGDHKETFEFARPYVTWDGILETLRNLKRHTDAAGAERKIRLHINFVGMKNNIADLPGVIRLAAEHGVSSVCLLTLSSYDSREHIRAESLRNAPEILTPIVLRSLRLAKDLGVTLTVPGSVREWIVEGGAPATGARSKLARLGRKIWLGTDLVRRRGARRALELARERAERKPAKANLTFCPKPWQDAYFACDGKVTPCCASIEVFGDLTTQDWQEIWNGPLYRNLRRTVHSWNPTKTCRDCGLIAGSNGGDQEYYRKYFDQFRAEPVPLDSPELRMDEGFHGLERDEQGNPHHYWSSKRGTISLPMQRTARFVRVLIYARHSLDDTNGGTCRVNGGPPEPFDNSCAEIHFPVDQVRDSRLRLELEIEKVFSAEGDGRELGVAVHGIEILYAR
jgi:MoaA/NifB/PqqE/SkfB family radical SAM enzyme